jgi:hypothetical protein
MGCTPKETLRFVFKTLKLLNFLFLHKIEFCLYLKYNSKKFHKNNMFIESYKFLKKMFDDEKEALLHLAYS